MTEKLGKVFTIEELAVSLKISKFFLCKPARKGEVSGQKVAKAGFYRPVVGGQ
ncbi:MAG: hypothetical protein JXR80_08350 [Deltaproteobacteria bacterium]|nr:hypothetical protein [Deltaproteobacteria bacterium]